VALGLPDDLKIAMDLIDQSLEDRILDDLRRIWVEGEDDAYEPWVLPDFRALVSDNPAKKEQ
jgi:hypothetical protein